ncbi:DUF979 domain-containing protein [uncultured Faecalicoccus sp.]|uniref:DUF979 domain-containing protein n=1 Tax=uncultured Faecalicoccus sp. TaxID=1971760 RepID=UPI002604C32A|nr:DUF979 domain-containing protein [uncultured Faecalicoccus sp.]
MISPIDYFMSADYTMSDKLLEIMYFLLGLISIYVAIRNLQDKTNEKRIGTFIFWFLLGLMFVLGPWIPSMYTGILMFLMVLSPIFKQVKAGSEPSPTQDEMIKNYKKIGFKVFIPALSIGLFALAAALFTSISPLFGMGVGVVVGIILLMIFSKDNKPIVFLKDGRRMLDIVGPLSMLPTLLAALGAVFTTAGVGDVISDLVSVIIPEGNVVIGIIVYAIGMALFTMVMGNAFAAITVMTVGIGAPFVLAYGADPVIIGSLALTCGYCGTLCTPMAANFNIVPVAVLEMKDDYGVIKNQVLIAGIMLVVQIIMMIVLS